MTSIPKINVPTDFGNSPKKEFLKDFNIAFAKGDLQFLRHCIADDITWNILGDKTIHGKEHFTIEMEQMTANKVSELILHHIISHGKDAAIYGTMVMSNGVSYAFSDFYVFDSSNDEKIASMTSFVIKI